MIVFYGKTPKHELVLSFAVAMSALESREISLVSDQDEYYSFLDEEVNGVQVLTGNLSGDNVIVDAHNVIPPLGEGDKVVLVTDGSRPSVEYCNSVFCRMEVDAVVVMLPEGTSINKVVTSTFKGAKIFNLPDEYLRRLECLYDGRVGFKKLSEKYIRGLEDLLVHLIGADSKDFKKLWPYLKKRG